MTETDFETRAIPIEQIISLQPFVVRRRIRFGDCDPAGIVYTPCFLDPISTSAWDLFMAEMIGGYGDRDKQVEGLDTPAKAVNMVFHSPVRYGDLVDLEVYCSGIGNTTFEVSVAGRGLDGTPRFDSTLTAICVAHGPYRSIAVPEYLKQRFQPYMRG